MIQLYDISYSDNSHLWPGGLSIEGPWYETVLTMPRDSMRFNKEFHKLIFSLAEAGIETQVRYKEKE